MPSTPAVFTVLCKGRDVQRQEVLSDDDSVVAEIYAEQGKDEGGGENNIISVSVHCQFNMGRCGFLCNASVRNEDKGRCAYVATLPNDGI